MRHGIRIGLTIQSHNYCEALLSIRSKPGNPIPFRFPKSSALSAVSSTLACRRRIAIIYLSLSLSLSQLFPPYFPVSKETLSSYRQSTGCLSQF